MRKRLFFVAAVSFVIAMLCLSLGRILADDAWDGSRYWWRAAWRDCKAPTDAATGKPSSITLPWDNTGALDISLPANVQYQPGDTSQAVISGDPEIISHVRLAGRVLALDEDFDCYPAGQMTTVRLTGGPVRQWGLSGHVRLDLNAIAQDSLDIHASGSSKISATGSTTDLGLHISGSGDAKLAQLAVKTADIQISGSGEADIAPQEEANVRISGSGFVRVHGHPKISSHISGSGRIEEAP